MSVDILPSIEIQSARKEHKCYWCSEKINRGESYTIWKSAGDGEIWSFKIHPECETAYHNAPTHVRECIYEDFRFGEFKRGSWEYRYGS